MDTIRHNSITASQMLSGVSGVLQLATLPTQPGDDTLLPKVQAPPPIALTKPGFYSHNSLLTRNASDIGLKGLDRRSLEDVIGIDPTDYFFEDLYEPALKILSGQTQTQSIGLDDLAKVITAIENEADPEEVAHLLLFGYAKQYYLQIPDPRKSEYKTINDMIAFMREQTDPEAPVKESQNPHIQSAKDLFDALEERVKKSDHEALAREAVTFTFNDPLAKRHHKYRTIDFALPNLTFGKIFNFYILHGDNTVTVIVPSLILSQMALEILSPDQVIKFAYSYGDNGTVSLADSNSMHLKGYGVIGFPLFNTKVHGIGPTNPIMFVYHDAHYHANRVSISVQKNVRLVVGRLVEEILQKFPESIKKTHGIARELLRQTDLNFMKGRDFVKNWQKYILDKLLRKIFEVAKKDKTHLQLLINLCDFHRQDLTRSFAQETIAPIIAQLDSFLEDVTRYLLHSHQET